MDTPIIRGISWGVGTRILKIQETEAEISAKQNSKGRLFFAHPLTILYIIQFVKKLDSTGCFTFIVKMLALITQAGRLLSSQSNKLNLKHPSFKT